MNRKQFFHIYNGVSSNPFRTCLERFEEPLADTAIRFVLSHYGSEQPDYGTSKMTLSHELGSE